MLKIIQGSHIRDGENPHFSLLVFISLRILMKVISYTSFCIMC